MRSPARLGRRGVPGSKRWYGLPLGLLGHLLLTFLGNCLCEVVELSRLQSFTLNIQNGPIFQPTDRVKQLKCAAIRPPRHLLWRVVGRGTDHGPPRRSLMRGPTVITLGQGSMASAGGSTPAALAAIRSK